MTQPLFLTLQIVNKNLPDYTFKDSKIIGNFLALRCVIGLNVEG